MHVVFLKQWPHWKNPIPLSESMAYCLCVLSELQAGCFVVLLHNSQWSQLWGPLTYWSPGICFLTCTRFSYRFLTCVDLQTVVLVGEEKQDWVSEDKCKFSRIFGFKAGQVSRIFGWLLSKPSWRGHPMASCGAASIDDRRQFVFVVWYK